MRSANSTGGIRLVPEHLDTDAIPSTPGQPVRVGADVQEIEVEGETHPPDRARRSTTADVAKEEHMGTTEGTAAGRVEIERWWPHLSIEAKHRLLQSSRPPRRRAAAEIERSPAAPRPSG